MSDSSSSQPKRLTLFAITPQDFVRFLNSKLDESDTCPICKGDTWNVMCPDDGGPTLRIGLPVRNREKLYYLSTFQYFCENCGYIRSHMASVVNDWLKQNPAPDADEAEDVDVADTDGDSEGES